MSSRELCVLIELAHRRFHAAQKQEDYTEVEYGIIAWRSLRQKSLITSQGRLTEAGEGILSKVSAYYEELLRCTHV